MQEYMYRIIPKPLEYMNIFFLHDITIYFSTELKIKRSCLQGEVFELFSGTLRVIRRIQAIYVQ